MAIHELWKKPSQPPSLTMEHRRKKFVQLDKVLQHLLHGIRACFQCPAYNNMSILTLVQAILHTQLPLPRCLQLKHQQATIVVITYQEVQLLKTWLHQEQVGRMAILLTMPTTLLPRNETVNGLILLDTVPCFKLSWRQGTMLPIQPHQYHNVGKQGGRGETTIVKCSELFEVMLAFR